MRTNTTNPTRTFPPAAALLVFSLLSSAILAQGATHPRFTPQGPLDDSAALPGQIIVVGGVPGYLKYNGGGPAYLCGTGNPETFLFLGKLNADGTRSGERQEQLIKTMAESGMNGFFCLMSRMRRVNMKGEGDDQHSPFVDFDPTKPLNEKVLDQWDGWISRMEEAGVVVQLGFFDDSNDVESIGWKLDQDGELHPHEKRYVEMLVKRFKHHRNIIWVLQESSNKLPRSRLPHFRKRSELIARVDNHNHPILQSFTAPDTYEDDVHPDRVTSRDYRDDPNIDLVTWLHVLPHGDDYEAQYQAYLKFAGMDRDRFIVMKSGTEDVMSVPGERIRRTEVPSRRYTWAAAMTGMHSLEEGHNVMAFAHLLPDDGRVVKFMEQTDFHAMQPRNALAAGSTKWVLANPGKSYIAYTYDYSARMGLSDLPTGIYDLLWFDPQTGVQVSQKGVKAKGGESTWSKPATMGNEVALYVKRAAAGATALMH